MAVSPQRLRILTPAGRESEIVPTVVSAGAASAGQPIALNSAGALDNSLFPAGFGVDVANLPATESLSAGAYINVYFPSGTPSMRNADGSTTGKEAHGFVLSAVPSGATGLANFGGVNTSVSGMGAGFVYLSDTAPGAGTATAPTAAGHIVQELGFAVSATSVQFDPKQSILRA